MTTACARCHRDLYADELGRVLCRICEDRTNTQLAAIAGTRGLYIRLGRHLQRGSGSGGPAVSGSRTAPAPLNLDILNLMSAGGPVLGPLETWVRDWETRGRATLCEAGTLQQRVNHACSTLRFNLAWAAAHHLAADEFAREIGSIHRTLTGVTGGEKPPRRIPVHCATDHCTGILRVTLDTPGETCQLCLREYGHAEALQLQPAEARRAAA